MSKPTHMGEEFQGSNLHDNINNNKNETLNTNFLKFQPQFPLRKSPSPEKRNAVKGKSHKHCSKMC